jgi:hypothetical protein
MPLNAWLARAVCLALFLGAGTQKAVWARPEGNPAATLSIAPSNLDFDPQTVDSASPPKTVTVNNTGGKGVSVSVLTSGIDFSQTNDCQVSLAAGTKCTVQVTFTPAIPGERTGTLNITDSNGPHIVVLTGVGK